MADTMKNDDFENWYAALSDEQKDGGIEDDEVFIAGYQAAKHSKK